MDERECIFCKIVKGEIPSVKLYEDEHCLVILDKFPATKGQALVLSKAHVSYILNLDDATYAHLFSISKKVASAIDRALHTTRTCFVVEGFEIPHVHIRLHPCYESILKVKGTETSTDELQHLATKIRSFL